MRRLNKSGICLLLRGRAKLNTFLHRLSEIFGLRDILLIHPIFLMIEPTNACNLRCPACPTGAGKTNRPKRIMSYREFKSIVNQVKGYVTNIALWNYGEPFLNNDLSKMIKYATSTGIYVTTSTNGEFFKSKKILSTTGPKWPSIFNHLS